MQSETKLFEASATETEPSFAWLKFCFVYALVCVFLIPGLISGMDFGVGSILLLTAPAFLLVSPIFFGRQKRELKKEGRKNYFAKLLIAILFFIYSLALLRASFSDKEVVSQAVNSLALVTIVNFALIVCTFICLSIVPATYRPNFLLNGIIGATLLICLLEMALIFGGIKHSKWANFPQAQTPAMLSSVFSITIFRQLLPIASGMHNMLVVPMLLLACSIAKFQRDRNLSSVFGILVGLYILLIVDSRIYFTAVPICFVILYFSSNSKRLTIIIGLFLPLVTLISIWLANWFPFIADLATGRYQQGGLFSGRQQIWVSFLEPFYNNGIFNYFFGFGAFGQVNSGMSAGYSMLFNSFADNARDLASLHNSYLQILADTGIIGFSTYLAVVVIALSRLWWAKKNHPNEAVWNGLLLFLMSLLLVSSSEVSMTPYNRESITAVFLVLGVSIFTSRTQQSTIVSAR